MNKKILLGLLTIAGAAALVIGVTTAFFSDTEVSTGNKFVAGKLNLKVDNTCHYNGMICDGGVWTEETQGSSEYPELIGGACECTWLAKDLTDELFFNFLDVKPGDEGEDTVSIHVDNNDAWVCAEIANLVKDDNGCDSPENKEDTSCSAGEGELQDNLYLTIWKDTDCDNVLDTGTPDIPGTPAQCLRGPGNTGEPCENFNVNDPQDVENCQLAQGDGTCIWVPAVQGTPAVPGEQVLVDNQPVTSGLWPIADSTTGGGPIQGGETMCLGIAWNVPIETSNIIQSDSLTGDVIFSAVQARNMKDFQCSDLYTEVCDGVDNNYNGQIDEGELWANKGQSCSVGTGACSVQGTYVCDANNPSGPTICSATAGNPGEEICNGIDDNCNGETDENNPGGGGNCETGLEGICSSGTLQCQSGALICMQNNLPIVEICGNGVDDDCDGQIDEECSSWISPTSHIDYGVQGQTSYWQSETLAYDGNANTSQAIAVVFATPEWGPFLELNFSNPINANKLRYFLWYATPTHNINQMDVDVYKNGSWQDIYQGPMDASDSWAEHIFTAGSVTKARIRYYNSGTNGATYTRGLAELQIWGY